MKKLLLYTCTLSVCLFLFSFSSSNTIGSFEDITQNSEYEMTTELGEFTEFENTRYTSDKTEWNHRRKTWTDFSKIADLNSIHEAINKN
ncbi:hypothetical protein ACSSV5_002216 [Psychroflexus sp. MBR-150]|jgi:hypothetical protein